MTLEVEFMPLSEAIHDLRRFWATDTRTAITSVTEDLLATGELQAEAVVDGVLINIDAGWWRSSSKFESPNNSVVFDLLVDGNICCVRAENPRISCAAWERWKARRVPAPENSKQRIGRMVAELQRENTPLGWRRGIALSST